MTAPIQLDERFVALEEQGTTYLIGSDGVTHRLSATGSCIWTLIASGLPPEALAEAYAAASEVDARSACTEVGRFLSFASELGAIRYSASEVGRADVPTQTRPRRERSGPSTAVTCTPAYWRRAPHVLQSYFPQSLCREFDAARFATWCRPPARARLYLRTEHLAPGSAQAGVLDQPQQAAEIYDLYRAQGEELTILLNRADRVAPEVKCLREALPPGPDWREHDTVATLSTAGSGIGFHAGHEDGYIVQLAGSRRWRVWWPDPLSSVRSL